MTARALHPYPNVDWNDGSSPSGEAVSVHGGVAVIETHMAYANVAMTWRAYGIEHHAPMEHAPVEKVTGAAPEVEAAQDGQAQVIPTLNATFFRWGIAVACALVAGAFICAGLSG